MDHQDAIRSRAAERYVARELSAEEENAFEEHFFDCPRCAEDVRFELTFAANTRAAARTLAEEAPLRLPKSGFFAGARAWLRLRPALAFSFAANLILAAALGYSLLRSAYHPAPARFISLYFAPGPTHGAGDVHIIPPGGTSYLVRFLAPAAKSTSYSYELLDADGRHESGASLSSPAGEDESLCFELPLAGLPAGIHTLVVRSGPNGDIVSWSKFRTSH